MKKCHFTSNSGASEGLSPSSKWVKWESNVVLSQKKSWPYQSSLFSTNGTSTEGCCNSELSDHQSLTVLWLWVWNSVCHQWHLLLSGKNTREIHQSQMGTLRLETHTFLAHFLFTRTQCSHTHMGRAAMRRRCWEGGAIKTKATSPWQRK